MARHHGLGIGLVGGIAAAVAATPLGNEAVGCGGGPMGHEAPPSKRHTRWGVEGTHKRGLQVDGGTVGHRIRTTMPLLGG